MSENPAPAQRWLFYQDTAKLWKWARVDVVGTVLDHSGCSFASREHTVADARRHGYRGYRFSRRRASGNAINASA